LPKERSWHVGGFIQSERDLDIVAAILKAAADGAAKTRIMYKAGLSSSQTSKYLNSLIQSGLMKNTDIAQNRRIIKVYRTTETGRTLLTRIESLHRLLG
jgi:predicted transcriptional regulator